MISAERLREIAFWTNELNDAEFEQARRGVIEKAYPKGTYICHRGDRLDSWTGVAAGLLKLSTVSRNGKAVTLAGIRAGGWFGEGTVLKNQPRQYDLVALRDTRLALMDRSTFLWLFENSAAFNRFLVSQLNERLGQFIALVEYDRMLDAPASCAQCRLAVQPGPLPRPRNASGYLAGRDRAAVGHVAPDGEQEPADF